MCRGSFRSPRASLIGVPNALLGVILYVVVAMACSPTGPPGCFSSYAAGDRDEHCARLQP